MVLVFKIFRERSEAKIYHFISGLSVISKISEELLNNSPVHQEIWSFVDFQFNFRPSCSTAYL